MHTPTCHRPSNALAIENMSNSEMCAIFQQNYFIKKVRRSLGDPGYIKIYRRFLQRSCEHTRT